MQGVSINLADPELSCCTLRSFRITDGDTGAEVVWHKKLLTSCAAPAADELLKRIYAVEDGKLVLKGTCKGRLYPKCVRMEPEREEWGAATGTIDLSSPRHPC